MHVLIAVVAAAAAAATALARPPGKSHLCRYLHYMTYLPHLVFAFFCE